MRHWSDRRCALPRTSTPIVATGLAYYRDKDSREIDLLLVQDGVVYPLEIKKTAATQSISAWLI